MNLAIIGNMIVDFGRNEIHGFDFPQCSLVVLTKAVMNRQPKNE